MSIVVGSVVRVKPIVSESLYGNIFGIVVDIDKCSARSIEYTWFDASVLTKDGRIESIPVELLERVDNNEE